MVEVQAVKSESPELSHFFGRPFGVTMQPSTPLGEEILQPNSLESADAVAMDLHI